MFNRIVETDGDNLMFVSWAHCVDTGAKGNVFAKLVGVLGGAVPR